MRQTIDTAPREGNVVILEDNAAGTYDVAHWSPEAGEWISESGEPSKITPTHWRPVPRDKCLPQKHDESSNPSQLGPSSPRARRLVMACGIAVALMALAVIRLYFDFQPETPLPSDSRKTELLAPRRQAEADQATVQAKTQVSVRAKQAVETSTPQRRQSLEPPRAGLVNQLSEAARHEIEKQAALLKASDETGQLKNGAQSLEQERQKTTALAQEAAAARQELTATTTQHRQALDEERARSAALASELATAQRENEMQTALLRKASKETEQLRQAEAANSTLSLEQERQKTATLAQEAAAARQELTTSTAKHRQALDEERAHSAALASELATAQRENEVQTAQSRKASEETGQIRQATESSIRDLRQSLQQERNRTEAMAQDIESARRTIDVRVTPEATANSGISKTAQVIELAAMAQPAAVEAQGSPEATRLIARARALLGQGNISAARIVLERAVETGSALASFTLAETYDPVILSTWGTYGTRGDTTKARELYAKAHAGGIQDAKDRLDELNQ